MFDVTAIGELLIDFTPSGTNEQGISLFARNPGGAPANVLAMHALLGGKTAFLGKVGRDSFGAFLRETLLAAQVDCSGLVEDPQIPTTLAFVQLDSHGDRSFSFYRKPGADVMLREEELRLTCVDECLLFHFGSVSLTDDPCRTATFSAVSRAKTGGKLISFDPNYRSLLWEHPEDAQKQMLRGVSMTDLLKVSEEEMTLLTGETDLLRGSEKLLNLGPSLVLVSLGAKGAFYRNPVAFGQLPTYKVRTIDTTGAGDAFLGAIHYRLHGMSREQLRALSDAELSEIVDFANAAGSLTTTRMGAIPAMPTLAQIENCRNSVPLMESRPR